MNAWVIAGFVWGLIAFGVLVFVRGAFVPVVSDVGVQEAPDVTGEAA